MPDNPSRVEFPGADGQMLSARIDKGVGQPKAWALFAHCFTCTKDLLASKRIAERLAAQGFGVMRFDFTGLGHSEGDFANTNFSTNVQDLIAAANWLRETQGRVDLLLGHSLGGAAVVTAARQIDGVRAVATIGAPADADNVIKNFSADLDEIETRGEADVLLAGRPFKIKKQFIEDVRGAKVRDAAGDLGLPLLILHSPIDETVGIDNATRLFVAAKHPKSFISLETADHLLSQKKDAEYAADMIAAWAEHHIPAQGEAVQTLTGHEDIVVEETVNGRYENAVTIGALRFIADEPERVGGGGIGPDPYQWLTAGLGACTSMTMRMYANRKNWPLDTVKVTLRHEKDYADDCEHCEEGRKVDIFHRDIEISGDLDEAQRARLIEIADKCPVHRTLHEPVVVRTRVV